VAAVAEEDKSGSGFAINEKLIREVIELASLDLDDEENLPTVILATAALASMCRHEPIKPIAQDAKVMRLVKRLLVASDEAMICNVLNAAEHLSLNEAVFMQGMQEGVFEKIFDIARAPDTSIPTSIQMLNLLYTIADSDMQKYEMIKAGVMKVLSMLFLRKDIRATGGEDGARRCRTDLSKTIIARTLVKYIGNDFEQPEDWHIMYDSEKPTLGDCGPQVLIGMLNQKVEMMHDPVLYFISRLSEDEDVASDMIDRGLLPLLIEVLQEADIEVNGLDPYVLYTTNTLANLASIGRQGAHGIITSDGINPTCALAASCLKHGDVQLSCATVLANLTEDDFGKKHFIDSGALEISVWQCDSSLHSEEVVQTALMTLSNISESDEMNLQLLEANFLPPVFHTLVNKDNVPEETFQYALQALTNFLRCGGHEALPDTIQDDVDIHVSAADALVVVAMQGEKYHQYLVEPGALWTIVGLSVHGTVDEMESMAATLADIAETNALRVPVAIHGGMEALIGLSSHEDKGVVREVARALRNLCGDPTIQSRMLNFGGIELFSSFAMSDDLEMQQYAAFALMQFSQNEEDIDRIIDDHGLSAILMLIASDDAEVQQLSAAALAMLSKSPATHGMLMEDAFEQLVTIMTTGVETAQGEAVMCMANMAANPNLQDELTEKRCPEAMLAILSDPERTNSHMAAAAALANFAKVKPVQELLFNIKNVSTLYALLEHGNLDVQTQTARIFAVAVKTTDGAELMVDENVFPHLIHFCKKCIKGTLRHYYVALTIAYLIRPEEAGSDVFEEFMITDFHVLDVLVKPREGSVEGQIALAAGIQTLIQSENEEYKINLKAPGSIGRKHLVAMQNSNNPDVMRIVSMCLCLIVTDEVSIEETQPILALMGSSDENAAALAKEALGNVTVAMPEAMVDGDVETLMEKAVALTSGNDIEKFKFAASTMRTLCSQQASRDPLLEFDGLPALVKLCRTDDDGIVNDAVFAFASFSSDPRIKVEILGFGVLRQLITLADSHDVNILAYLITILNNLLDTEKNCAEIEAESAQINIQARTQAMKIKEMERIQDPPKLIESETRVLQALEDQLKHLRDSLSTLESSDRTIADEGYLKVLVEMSMSKNLNLLRSSSKAISYFTYNDDAKFELVQLGYLHRILVHLPHKDSKLFKSIISITCDMCDDTNNVRTLIENGIVKILLTIVKKKPEEDVLKIAEVICRISEDTICHDELLAMDGLVLISQLAGLEDIEKQQLAAFAMSNLTILDEVRDLFVEKGGTELVVKQSKSEDDNLKVQAAKCFGDLSESDRHHSRIKEEGGLDVIVEMLAMNHTMGVRFATRALANMCRTEEIRLAIGDADGLKWFKRFSQSPDVEIARFSNLCMARLMKEKAFQERMINMWGDMNTVKLLLDHADVNIARCAALGLSEAALNPDWHGEILEDNGIVALCVVEKKEAQDPEVKRCILRALCNVMETIDIRNDLHENQGMIKGAIADVHKVNNGQPRLQAQAFNFLGILGQNDLNKIALDELDGANVLALGVNTPNIAVKCAAAECISVVGTHRHVRFVFCKESDGLTGLLRMCGIPNNKKAHLSATKGLATLCMDAYVKDLVADHPDRGLIITLCQNADDETRSYAVKTIGALSEICDVGLVLDAMEQGAASDVALAKYYGDIENERRAATKLARLCANPNNHSKVLEMGGIRELTTLAFSSDEHVQRKAAMSLADLAEAQENRVSIILEGAVTPLVRVLLKSEIGAVRDDASRCLQKLTAAQKATIWDMKIAEPCVEKVTIMPRGMFVGGKEGQSIYRWFRLETARKHYFDGMKAEDGPKLDLMQGDKDAIMDISDAARKPNEWTDDDDSLLSPDSPLGKIANMGNLLSIDPLGEKEDQAALEDDTGALATRRADNKRKDKKLDSGAGALALIPADQVPKTNTNPVLREVLVGQERNYTPSAEDVGYRLKFEWIPVTIMGVRGDSLFFESKDQIMPGAPSVEDIIVKRVSKDDAMLIGSGNYVGGEEGECLYTWKRMYKNGRKEVVRGAHETTYNPDRVDIGCKIIFGMIPVRVDGVRGPCFFSEPSDTIAKCPPSFRNLTITGLMMQGKALFADGRFVGGAEGPCEWQWFRQDPGDIQWSVIPDNGKRRTYNLVRRDIGCRMRVMVKPINQAKEVGRPCTAESTEGEAVANAPPKLLSLRVSGGPFHTSILLAEAEYFGGFEGESLLQWYRSIFRGPWLPIKNANGISYQPTVDDANARIKLKYIPVRDDDMKGAMMEASAVALCIDAKVQNLVARMIVYGEADFKCLMINKETKVDEPRVIEMDSENIKVCCGVTCPVDWKYDADLGYRVQGEANGIELNASWSEDIKVVLHPSDVTRFTVIFDECDDFDSGLVKYEFRADNNKARDIMVLTIRSFCAYNLRGYVAKGIRKKKKRKTKSGALKKHRTKWLKQIQGKNGVKDTMLDINDRHDGEFRIESAKQIKSQFKEIGGDDVKLIPMDEAGGSEGGLTARSLGSETERSKGSETQRSGIKTDRSGTQTNRSIGSEGGQTNRSEGEGQLALTTGDGTARSTSSKKSAGGMSNPLYNPEEAVDENHIDLNLSPGNKYQDIDLLLKRAGVGNREKGMDRDIVKGKHKNDLSSKLSRVNSLLEEKKPARKPRVLRRMEEEAHEGQLALPSMGDQYSPEPPRTPGSPPSLSESNVLALPAPGGSGGIGRDSARSATSRPAGGALALVSPGSPVDDNSGKSKSPGSLKGLSPLQRAVAGVAINAKAKKSEKERENMQALALVQNVAAPGEQKEKPAMIKEVSGVLDRIKAKGAKRAKEAEKEDMMIFFKEAKAKAVAEGKPPPTMMDKEFLASYKVHKAAKPVFPDVAAEDDAPLALPSMGDANLALSIEGMSPDRQRGGAESSRSDTSRSMSSESMSSRSTKANMLAGSLLGKVVDKNKMKEKAKAAANAAAAKVKAEKDKQVDKKAEMLAKRSAAAEERRIATTESESPLKPKVTAAKGKTDIKSKIEQFKQDRKAKKSVKNEMINRVDATDEVLALPPAGGASMEAVAAVDPKLAFMTKGAFFVTKTAKSDAATIKVAVSPDFNEILWKEHTDKTEHRIDMSRLLSFDSTKVLREGREKLSFSILYTEGEGSQKKEKEFLVEAISERAKKQWLNGLANVTKVAVV